MKPQNRLIAIMLVITLVSFALGGLAGAFHLQVSEAFSNLVFGVMILASLGGVAWSSMRLQTSNAQLSAELAKLRTDVELLRRDFASHGFNEPDGSRE